MAKPKNDGDAFWIKYFFVIITAFLIAAYNLMLGFAFMIFSLFGFLLVGLIKMNKSDKNYQESPWFYESAKILIVVTLLTTAWVTYYEVFKTEEEVQLAITNPLIQPIATFLLFGSFIAAPIGFIAAGIKSIREKQSITPGALPKYWKNVEGPEAVISGSYYVAVGILFLIGEILFAVSILTKSY